MNAPTGTVTFLFTDIEGSTRLWDGAPDAMADALEAHDDIVRGAIAAHGGAVFATGGDGFAAAFQRAGDAAAAALEAQRALTAEAWSADAVVRVRMALHTGEAVERGGDYFGTALNRTARLMAIAHGGQTVCTDVTAALLDASVPRCDLGEHRLRDLLAPVHVYQLGSGDFAPLRSTTAALSNLPVVLTELVGRDDDVKDVATALRRSRLVTLTGVGGVGKTRLALAAAADVASDVPDGVWFVELAAVGDADDVVRAIAATLGATSAIVDTRSLVAYLEPRNLLLVLDNCEHLLDAVADAVDGIMASSPDVRALITSREPLGLDGEIVRRVRSLAVPDGAGFEDTLAAPAVQLFIERATAVNDEFAFTPANADAVAEICRRLDGIPLAIELAAARVGSMTPADLAARLDERFRLLAGGRRAQERHRTLLATVSWSHDLLTPVEQVVFRRLSVFPASFDLAAAEAVAVGDDLDRFDASDALTRLVERSLVQHDSAIGRYRLLETLRQFGADRLAAAGEGDGARDRYAAHYCAVMHELAPQLVDDRYDAAYTSARVELDNLRATADWLVRRGGWRALLDLVVDGRFFFSVDVPAEARTWLEHAVERGGPRDDQEHVDAVGYVAAAAANQGEMGIGVHFAEVADAEAERRGVARSPWAEYARMQAHLVTGESTASLAASERLLRVASQRGDAWACHMAECFAVTRYAALGRWDEAHRARDAALQRAIASRNAMLMGSIVTSMCSMELYSRPEPNFAAAREVLDRFEPSLGNPGEVITAWLRCQRAGAVAHSDPVQSARCAIEAVRIGDRVASDYVITAALEAFALTLTRLELYDHAERVARHVAGAQHRIAEPGYQWIRRDTAAALHRAGRNGDAPPSAMTRRELLALLADVEGRVAATR